MVHIDFICGKKSKGLKKSKSSNLFSSSPNRLASSCGDEPVVYSSSCGPTPKIKGQQKESRKLLNMLLIKKIRVGSSNTRFREQLMLNQSFDSARILPVYGNLIYVILKFENVIIHI